MTDVESTAAQQTTPLRNPKPTPVPDSLTAPFWAALSDGVITIQQCQSCGTFSHPPVDVCGNCLTTPPRLDYVPVSGRAVVRSWTTVWRTFLPSFAADVPYLLVVGELIEQPGLTFAARLVSSSTEPVPGEELALVRQDMGGMVLPVFVRRADLP